MKVTAAMRKAVYREFAAAGGRARKRSLTKERRIEIAKTAANARWGKRKDAA